MRNANRLIIMGRSPFVDESFKTGESQVREIRRAMSRKMKSGYEEQDPRREPGKRGRGR